MLKFNDWFKTKLIISRYPLPNEIIKSKAKYIINVSDEYIQTNHLVCNDYDKFYFWFPMNECSSDIGLNSIFGALQIMWIAEQEGASVILHCAAGANRSPTVAEAYYFMRTGKHLVRTVDKEIEDLNVIFENPEDLTKVLKNNRLENNIYFGHLPATHKMETFLKECGKQFKLQNRENEFKTAGNLEIIKLNSKI
jgi:hypothetical protein